MQTLTMLAAVLAGALLYPLISRSAPATGSLAPDFVLKDVRGHNLRLSEYRGDIVIISFWSSWCGHCRESLSRLNAIASLPGVDAPVLLGVNLDGDAGRAAAVAESMHLSFPMLVDAKQSVGHLYRVDDPPLTLLVDRDGRVRGAWAGDTNPMPELARQIKELQSQ
ncbi:MAG: TlpA family protein disulfide reductase [Steroidobacteraceae bacterium]|nr:TlpA family protein disulfide reductase [Steroidobacteraceae bacterium]